MSGTPEDEAKARLEVAQLYEGMPGQAAKAARYYFAAAEIFRGAGLLSRAREIYQKVVQLDPANAQAQTILQSIIASAGGTQPAPQSAAANQAPTVAPGKPDPPPSAAQTARPVQPPRPPAGVASPQPSTPPPSGNVAVPIPWVGREARYTAAARAQLQVPPDRFKLPYDPLPPVDPNKVAARAEARKKAQQEINRKSQTRVESAFGGSDSPFSTGTKFAGQAGPPGNTGGGRFPAAAAASAAPTPPVAEPKPKQIGQPSVDLRGGNRDLADAIRRKLQGG